MNVFHAAAEIRRPVKVHTRWAIRRDMPECLMIDTSTPEPWGEDKILRRLEHRDVIGKVAEVGDDIAGFYVYRFRRYCLEVLMIAVHPDWRRRGVGTAIVDDLKKKLSLDRRTYLEAAVSEDHLGAHLFLSRVGFKAETVERGGAEGRDLYRFAYRITGD